MKRILKLFLVIATLAAVTISSLPAAALAESPYEVDGWRKTVTFDEPAAAYRLGLYTEFDKLPWIMDGRLYFWTLAEQKAVFLQNKYNDLDVSADFGTINDHGKFDVGFYIHANRVGSAMDYIDAWNVNLERGANDKTFKLKLHRFYDNGWRGAKVELSGIKLPMNEVHLRVVVKSGILYAFVNHETEPRFSYNIGETEGYVGFRCYYSPNWVDNFSVVGVGNSPDETLSELLDKARRIDGSIYTEESRSALYSAISAAENAQGQYRMEEAEEELIMAINNLMESKSFSDMTEVIARAKLLSNADGKVYTKNSWRALQLVISKCETLDETASESEISYWTNRLILKINDLIRYGGAL